MNGLRQAHVSLSESLEREVPGKKERNHRPRQAQPAHHAWQADQNAQQETEAHAVNLNERREEKEP